jgi:hypothetical protein
MFDITILNQTCLSKPKKMSTPPGSTLVQPSRGGSVTLLMQNEGRMKYYWMDKCFKIKLIRVKHKLN